MRYFFMATDNHSPFTDYYAHAISAQAKYERGFGRNFRFAAGASATYNISSSDLARLDTLAKRPIAMKFNCLTCAIPKEKQSTGWKNFMCRLH